MQSEQWNDVLSQQHDEFDLHRQTEKLSCQPSPEVANGKLLCSRRTSYHVILSYTHWISTVSNQQTFPTFEFLFDYGSLIIFNILRINLLIWPSRPDVRHAFSAAVLDFPLHVLNAAVLLRLFPTEFSLQKFESILFQKNKHFQYVAVRRESRHNPLSRDTHWGSWSKISSTALDLFTTLSRILCHPV